MTVLTPSYSAEALADRAAADGDLAGAASLLEQVTRDRTTCAPIWLKLAAMRRALGQPTAALAAVDGALAADPLDFTALLMRASLLETLDNPLAGEAYGRALARRPDGALPPPLAAAVARAEAAHTRHIAALAASIEVATHAAFARATRAERARLDRFVSNSLGRTRHFGQDPTHYAYPGLPAIEFHDRAEFPWLRAFEERTDEIEAELHAALATDGSTEPYIAYSEGIPLGKWGELNHSDRWLAIHLVRSGLPDARLAALCPKTMGLLECAPQPRLRNRSPAAMFSALAPRTRIPPHTGVANVRLVVHVPLIIPRGCGLRVGGEVRQWRRNEALVFDDAIEHEAWNDSDQLRVVLIFDIWNPSLSPVEREAVAAVFAGLKSD